MPKTYLERQTGEEIVLAGEMTNDLEFQIIFGYSIFEINLGRNLTTLGFMLYLSDVKLHHDIFDQLRAAGNKARRN